MNIFIRIGFVIILALGSLSAFGQTASILPPGKTTFFDANGNPLSSGTVTFYIPSTTTFKTTWQDADETIPNTNPVVLDSAGRAIIYGSGTYRQVVKDSKGNTIWDQLTSSTGSGGTPTPQTGDGNLVGTTLPWSGLVAPNQYVFAYGQELLRATYPEFLTAITLTSNVTCTSGSPTLTNVADTTQIPAGAAIESVCITPGTTVVSTTSTTITLSANASVTTVTTAQVFPWGNGNGATTFNVPDLRGRVLPGRDNMGGTAANRLTSTYYGETAAALGANGGAESKVLLTANLPAYTPSGSIAITDPGHRHEGNTNTTSAGTAVFASAAAPGGTAIQTQTATTGITAAFTGVAQGGTSTAFSIVQPSMTINYIVKVTPDTNSAEATGVLSLGGMTGVIACGSGLTCTGNIISTLSSALVVGTTTITSGTSGRVLYDNGGLLGEYTLTGSAGSVVMSTSPTISGLTVTGSFTATGLVTNAALANPSTTVNGQTCTLGSTCTVTAVASSLVVGTTTITSGTTTRVLYNNGGTLGEYTITGTGSVVMGTAPTIAGGSITGLTALAIRDTSAAFDVTLAATSSTPLSAGRTLTIDMVNAARTVSLAGNLTLAGAFTTSGANSLTLTTTGSTNVTLPTTGTVLTADSTATLTNKTFNTAGTGNTFQINGTGITAVTGTGSVVLATSPTLVTPTLGAATATSINGLTITSSTGVLTIANGKTLTASNTLTFTGTDSTSFAFPSGSGTVATLDSTGTFTNKTISGSSNTLSNIANASLTNSSVTIGATAVALGATLAAATGRGSSGLNIDQCTEAGDTDYTIQATDRCYYHTALSAARTDTLPAANAVNAGQVLYILDVDGVATGTETVTLQRAGSDTVNGTTSYSAIASQYGTAMCWSDGVSKWNCAKPGSGGGGSGTVQSVTAGTGLTGGTITVSGTIAADVASAANYRANTANKLLDPNAVWNAAAIVALTDAATIAIDMDTGFNFSVTLGGNRTLGNPTNPKVGQSGAIVVTIDGTPGRTLAPGTNWECIGGCAATLGISTAAGAKNIIYYWVQSSTSIIITGVLAGVS